MRMTERGAETGDAHLGSKDNGGAITRVQPGRWDGSHSSALVSECLEPLHPRKVNARRNETTDASIARGGGSLSVRVQRILSCFEKNLQEQRLDCHVGTPLQLQLLSSASSSATELPKCLQDCVRVFVRLSVWPLAGQALVMKRL